MLRLDSHSVSDRQKPMRGSVIVPCGAHEVHRENPRNKVMRTKLSDAPTGTILDHFVEWGRSRAVWTYRRCGAHAAVFTSTRFVCLNLGRLVEIAGRSPEVERDRREIVGDIGRYNRVYLDSGA